MTILSGKKVTFNSSPNDLVGSYYEFDGVVFANGLVVILDPDIGDSLALDVSELSEMGYDGQLEWRVSSELVHYSINQLTEIARNHTALFGDISWATSIKLAQLGVCV